MMRFFYTLLFYLALPLILLRLWQRGKRQPAYRKRWRERFGYLKKANPTRKTLWFHTVSVGEFIAAKPLIQHYLNTYDIVVTTTTPTGSERVIDAFGDQVYHCYCPYDIPAFIRRFLHATQAQVFICLETELWPNLLYVCQQQQVPVIIANARLSEKSAAGYQKFSRLTQQMLSSIHTAAIQFDEDAQRFLALGLQEKSCIISGNIKFDLHLEQDLITKANVLKSYLNDHQQASIWIAASTHQGEDEHILSAYSELRKSHKHLRLLLVPRHPERFDDVYTLCQQSGHKVVKRSEQTPEQHMHFDIMLGDTMGELLLLYGVSDIAFVGGSLVNNGGHNYIEPAAWSLPMVSGASTFNFQRIASALEKVSALTITPDTQSLVAEIDSLLKTPELAKTRGLAGKQFAESNRGAMKQLIHIIDGVTEEVDNAPV